jgi:clan AA aspartic protease (TIGR02281 family)
MNRFLFVITVLLIGAGALAYGDADRIAYVQKTMAATATDVSTALRPHAPINHSASSLRAVDIPRKNGGEFAVRAKINNLHAPMLVDTGATSVVLTYETARAIGLPLELLDYDVELETASGRTRAARLTLDRLAVGSVVERSVPALVVPRGQAKNNLLGMSFLDRLESWEVRADRMTIRGYP